MGRKDALLDRGHELIELIPVMDKDSFPTTFSGWANYFGVSEITLRKKLASIGYIPDTITVLRKVGKNG